MAGLLRLIGHAKPVHYELMIRRGYKFQLCPNEGQEQILSQFAGATRFVYNLALEQRRDWWRQFAITTGRHINAAAQSVELSQLRREVDWLAAVPRSALEQALRDLDGAFQNFFTGKAKFPRPRARGVNDSFRIQGREVRLRRLNAKWSAVRLPNLPWIKFRSTRPIIGDIKNVTVSLAAGKWYVSFGCEVEHETPANFMPAIGIDRGVATTLALSNGDMLSVPAGLAKIERRRRTAQRILARRKRGSKRRDRQRRRVARLHAWASRIRRDFHHRAALSIAQRFGVAVLEDLKTKNMTASAKGTVEAPGRNVRQKAGLNRVILNAGWRQFETILTYKMEERGGRVVKVDPAYTSQTCSACGVVDARSRESQARFACIACGHSDHADINAAKNILRRSTASMRVEEPRRRPDEARTRGGRKHVSNLSLRA